ncbi:MAG: hypothetical protein AB2662_05035 [Candidatus Thiodiazotropha sp.]
MVVKVTGIICIIFAMFPHLANAYNWMAHMKLSTLSAERSILSNTEFMDGIGVDHLAAIHEEMNEGACSDGLPSVNLEYIYCGAVLEDRYIRGINHFYDPVNDVALDPARIGIPFDGATKAPDWALEDDGDVSTWIGGIVPVVYIPQLYSLKHAYVYYLESSKLSTKNLRNESEMKFYRSLGQVVHMVHDMAQPEHVRNDQHIPIPFLNFHSEFEAYADSVARKLDYSLYNYPQTDLNTFDIARKIIVDRDNELGLSQFTNANFISNDTNFVITPHGEYFAGPYYSDPQPTTRNEYEVIRVPVSDLLGYSYHGEIWFVSSMVYDKYLEALASGNYLVENSRASALNMFAKDLDGVKKIMKERRKFGVNDFTFASAMDFLLPRAISYGTGMINYFFRGHVDVMNIHLSKELGTDVEVNLTVKNTTGRGNTGGEVFGFNNGTFTLYYDSSDGIREAAVEGRNSPSSVNLNYPLWDQDEIDLVFEIPVGANWDRSKPLTLVFDGIVGQERGIVKKVFYPNPLLAFNVNGVVGDSPVPNNIDVYASYDLGYTWSLVGGFVVVINDPTQDPFNHVQINTAVNLGEGNILASASYVDYLDDQGNQISERILSTMVRSNDYGQTWNTVPFTWQPLLEGSINISDVENVHKNTLFTGEQNLTGVNLQHPLESGQPRTYQLFHSSELGVEGSWMGSTGLGTGGLPEVNYIGNSSFVITSILEGDIGGAGNEGGDFQFDSILMRTDDGGQSFYRLTDFSTECGSPTDPSNKVTKCKQSIEYLGDERLIGWTYLRGESLSDYSKSVPLHISDNGGMSWTNARVNAPFDNICEGFLMWEGNVEDLIYIGKSVRDNDVMIAHTQCVEVTSTAGQQSVEWGDVTGESLFVTHNSGKHWSKVQLPPGHNGSGVFLFTGDNGAIPGLYNPVN